MDIDDVKLKIKEILEKINFQESSISTHNYPIPVLELDMQLMYIRELYDQYLILKNACIESKEGNTHFEQVIKSDDKQPIKHSAQIIMTSLFDANDTVLKGNKETEIIQKNETEKNIKEEESKQDKINDYENTNQEIKEEHAESPIPIEIDIDNIEFVEEEDYDDEKDTGDDSYSENYFPQINPFIKEKEPDIAGPVTKETLRNTAAQINQAELIGEKYVSEKKDLNTQFTTSTDNNIASKFQKNQGNDLMKNIDINDKFLFIRELFNGNGSSFTDVINQLNQYAKLTDAIDFMEKTKSTYRWKDNSEAYLRLYELLLKKYSNQ